MKGFKNRGVIHRPAQRPGNGSSEVLHAGELEHAWLFIAGVIDTETAEGLLQSLHDQAVFQLFLGKFQELGQHLSMNYDPDTLLFEDSLRHIAKPVNHCLRDWMHTSVSNGVAGTETARLLQKALREGIFV
jgi:hypothetical protein